MSQLDPKGQPVEQVRAIRDEIRRRVESLSEKEGSSENAVARVAILGVSVWQTVQSQDFTPPGGSPRASVDVLVASVSNQAHDVAVESFLNVPRACGCGE